MRTTTGRRGRRTTRALSGATMLTLALGLSAFGTAPAAAQDDPHEAPATTDEGEPLEITGAALFVSPVTGAVPTVLTSSFPPSAVCVLQPDLCPDRPEGLPKGVPWRGEVAEGLQDVLAQGRDLPVQPVPPDTAAVSFLGGATRYQTAIVFDAPAVPEGEDVMRFELTIPQSEPTYDLSSPAFRRAVLAVFETLSSRDPADFAEGLAASLQESPIDTSKLLGFEACPLLGAFEPAGAPQASDVSALPMHDDDGEQVVAVDCTFGGNGVYDEEAGVWRVDLAFTAQAWADGELDNHGVLLRPIGAPNLAFGDADTTTNAQLALDLTEVTAAMETAEAFDPGDFESFPEDGDLGAGGGEDAFGGDLAVDDSFDSAGSDLGAPLGGPDFPAGDLEDGGFAADAPEVAGGLEAAPELALDAQAARPAGAVPTTPWWVWLVAPLLLGGAYLTGSAVLAPAAVTGAGGGGALTRMLAKHAATSSVPTQI